MRRPITFRMCGAIAAATSLALFVPRVARADARTEAKAHYRRGMAAISDGKYEEGISELQRAYEILPHPNVLYNIARAYAESGDLEGAVAGYRKYLEGNPADRDDVAQIVASLESRIRKQQANFSAAQSAAPGTPSAPASPATGTNATPASTPAPAPQAGASAANPSPLSEPLQVGTAKTEDVFQETVVTASKGAQNPLDAPSSTSIVTEQDIRLSGITQIPELLRRLAGVDIMEPTASQPEVSLRGFNQRLSNKVLVLVNGRSVFVDLLGSTFWASLSIGVEDIERIEVVRGPGSALYGADAFNGVINIITKAPGAGRSGFNGGYGTNGETHGSLWAAGRDLDVGWRIAAGYDYRPVWSREVTDTRRDVHLVSGDQDTAQKTNRFDMRFTRDLGNGAVAGVGAGLTLGRFDVQGYGPINYLRINQWQSSDVTAFVNTKHIEARAFWNDFRTNGFGLNAAQIGQNLTQGYASSEIVDGEVQYVDQFAIGKHVTNDLHLGIGYRLKTVHWSYQDHDRAENHESVYLHDEAKIGEAVALVGDIRLDYVPYLSRVVPSPRATVLVHPTHESTVRATVATAFRTPTFLESYVYVPVQLPVSGASAVTSGAKEDVAGSKLKPENILTAELGYLNQASDYFTFDSAVFYNHVTNLSQLAPNRPVSTGDLANPNGSLGQFDPASATYPVFFGGFNNQCQRYDVLGGEVGARVFPAEGLDLYANYTLMSVTQDLSGCSAEERALIEPDARTSEHKINGGIQVRTRPGIDGEISVHYVSPQIWAEQITNLVAQRVEYQSLHIDAYTLVNARVGYRFLRNTTELSVVAFNLLGTEHREHPFGQLIGRRVMGFLTYRF